MRWAFLRHGESIANVGGWLSGWEDVPLTPLGEAQAVRAGEALRGVPLRRALVSDLQRARRTAALALGQVPGGERVPVHVLPELRERHMGSAQRQPIAAWRADGRWERWLVPWQAAPPGGETHAQVLARGLAALRAWEAGEPVGDPEGEGVTLVVTHGSWVRGLLGWLEGLPLDAIHAAPAPPNATPLWWRGPLSRAPR